MRRKAEPLRSFRGRRALGLSLALPLFAVVAGAPTASWSVADAATNEDIALLVLANAARADPSADGGTEPVVPPLLWNDSLGAAARFHSDDMALHGCVAHDSCNGQGWAARIKSFYGSSYRLIGETIARGSTDPYFISRAILVGRDHRAILLSGGFNEFGAAIELGHDAFGPLGLGTEDFGSRGDIPPTSLPTIPAACVLPRQGSAGTQRELLANYYDHDGGPPRSVHALLGSACVDMTLFRGSPDHGTYRTLRAPAGSGCIPLVFEAIRSDGTRYRWPETGAILVGVGDAVSCDERTLTAPIQDCGGGGAPAPTATPAPAQTPIPPGGGDPELSDVRVMLKAGPANASKGKVQIAVTLDPSQGLDAASSDIHIQLAFGQGGDWSKTLPQSCGNAPCMKGNKRGTVYVGKYGANGPTATLTLLRSGAWRLRVFAHGETLAAIAPGPVMVTVGTKSANATATVSGKVHDGSLIAQ